MNLDGNVNKNKVTANVNIFGGILNNENSSIQSINWKEVKDNTITVQEGNLDGITNTFQGAKKDWQTKSYTLDQLRSIYGGVMFAIPRF